MQTIKTNCPRDCYDGCGIVARIEAGQPVKIAGDAEHPVSRGKLCAKCGTAYNGLLQDESARLHRPLRRVGPKGSGRFEPIAWDEALDEIAARFNDTIEKHGAESILTMKYSGTLSLLAFFFPDRWVNHVGASVVDYGTICNTAGYVAWELLFGTAERGFDPRTARDSSCILVWGANPSHTAPHMHEHWLRESPAKIVVIDPLRTKTAAAADLHLQPRPGTDAALAFAMLHELRAQGHFDQAFIDAHTLGYEEILADIERCTPEWAARVTGVGAADIRRAASLYGAGPALLWCGQGLQRQPLGGNVMRAAGLLPALTGNVGKAGAGFFYLNDSAGIAGVDYAWLTGDGVAAGAPKTVTALDLADRLASDDEFRALLIWNCNPLASCSNQQRLRLACQREDLFTVVIDLFQTDSANYADIVLPAASFLEFDDLTYSYMNLLLGVQSRVREPIGDSLSNQEIFRRLAGAMGLENPALFAADDELIAGLLEQCGYAGGFDALQQQGHFAIGGDEPLLLFEDLEFGTPSGRIEIASRLAERAGLPATPLPAFDAPPQAGRLRLISPASNWRMNDTYGNDPRLRKRAGAAELIMNAADADRLGVVQGQKVELSTAHGALELVARIDDNVLPGTALSYKGRWPSLEPGGVNLNFLYAGLKADMGESSAVHGLMVEVRPLPVQRRSA